MNSHSDLAQKLSRSLHARAERIEPSPGGLDAIRSRTSLRSQPAAGRRPWLLGAAAAGLAAAATVLGVSVLAQGPDTPPAGQPASTGQWLTVPVYYLGDSTSGPRLYREIHRVRTGDETSRSSGQPSHLISDAAGLAAVREMLTGQPHDPDYFTPWSGTSVDSVRPGNGVLAVDLTATPSASGSGNSATLAVQQLVYTVQAAEQSADPVLVTVAGHRVDSLLGVPIQQPIGRADPLSVQARVQVTAPDEGAAVRSPVTVRGIANVFEANVSWDVLRDGRVVKQGHATAARGMTFSPFQTRIALAPGRYTLRCYESSAADGRPTYVDTKTFTVR